VCLCVRAECIQNERMTPIPMRFFLVSSCGENHPRLTLCKKKNKRERERDTETEKQRLKMGNALEEYEIL
jgi:hypothetical protein